MNPPTNTSTRRSALRIVLVAILLFGASSLPAADYMTQTLGTRLEDPADLALDNPRVLSETVLADGRILLEAASDIRNLAETTWTGARASVRDQVAGIAVDVVTGICRFANQLVPGAVIHSVTNLFTVVAAPDVAIARAEVLAGSVFTILAEEAGSGISTLTSNLVLEATQIISETTLTNGRVLIEVAADVRNAGPLVYSNVTVNLDAALGSVPYTPPLGSSTYGSLLGAHGVATGMESLFFAVRSNEVATVRSNVVSGAALTRSGTELWVFSAPPKGVDRVTETAWRWPAESAGGGDTRLVFTNATAFLQGLRAGDLLIEDPGVNRLVAVPVGVTEVTADSALPTWLPFQVASVTVLTNEVQVVGQRKLLRDVIKSATFVADAKDAYDHPVRDPYNPTLENTYTGAEQTNRADVAAMIVAQYGPRDSRLAELKGMTAIPWHFNETLLSDKIKLSGELLLRQSGVRLEIKIRDFKLERATARIEAGAVLNLVIESAGGENTEGKPEDRKSKNLIPEDLLPAVSFNLGGVPVTVQPVLSLKAGVEANLPTSLTLPLQSVFTVGLEMGFDRGLKTGTNDGFYSTPYTEFIPLRVSDPTVFDDLAATLDAWAEVGVGLRLGVGNDTAALQAGPSVAVRLANNFALAPLKNPWWSVDTGVDVIGRFTLDLSILGFDPVELVQAEASLHHFDLFHHDAGGPLIGPIATMDSRSKMALHPLSGQATRWGRLLVPGGWGGFRAGFVLRPTNSTEVIVGGGSSLARFSGVGELVWAKDLGFSVNPSRAVALADGSFTVTGASFNDVWLANYSAAGDRNWTVTLTPAGGLTVRELVLGHNLAGAPEYYLVGHVQRALVTRSDPEVIKLDAAGTVLWARSYDLDGIDDEAHGATLTADGNLVLSGVTGHPVDPPSIGTADPGNFLKTQCGLLMKVAGADGTLLWANAYPSHWGLDFNRVLEAPDGTLYAAGAASRIVTLTRPSNLFARFSSDGTLMDHVTVGEDADWVDELANAGNTPYDYVSGLIWTDEGLWACGATGLGAGAAGWVMGLTPELGVRFHAVFDGPNAEEMLDLVDVGDGLAVLGNTYSSYPWGVGGLPVPFLLKLPWEGIMRFHPDSRLSSLYLQPRVYKTSGDPEYIVFSSLTIPGAGVQTFSSYSGRVPFGVNPVTVDLGAALPAPKALTNYTTFALESIDRSLVKDYSSWAAYSLLTGALADPAADPDGDGVVNYLEAYFGRNPWVKETSPILSIFATETNRLPQTMVAYDRATFARAFPVHLESAENLTLWGIETNLVGGAVTLDATREHVSLVGPRSGPMRFFRAVGDPSATASKGAINR